jgi:hypothetical protein
MRKLAATNPHTQLQMMRRRILPGPAGSAGEALAGLGGAAGFAAGLGGAATALAAGAFAEVVEGTSSACAMPEIPPDTK